MTTETNEMDSAAYVAAAPSSAADTMPTLPSVELTKDDGSPPDEINTDITLSNPVVSNKDINPESVYVYANNITPVSSMGDSAIVSFDIVFSVSHTDDAGTTSVHQVVKRIGVDKMKMVNDAKMTTPISIVEAKKPATKEESLTTKDRLKALAGLK